MKNLMNYQFEKKNLEVIVSESGDIFFIANEVCAILDIKNSRDALSRLDENEKLMSEIPTSGQIRKINLVNESGLYSLIFSSSKKEANIFKKWVTSEVLPCIRKNGYYSTKDVSKLIGEENISLERRVGDLDSEINSLYIELSTYKLFRNYNAKLSEKKAIVEKITANNKALKINSTHMQNILTT
jgi:anti-repressor protein